MNVTIKHISFFIALLFSIEVVSMSRQPPTIEDGSNEELGYCNNYDPNKRPYFGDMHTHTGLSLDAAQFGVRNDTSKAYEFAKGQTIGLPPYDSDGNPTRFTTLERPLDFAGISDHAEFLAETDICFEKDSLQYLSPYCITARGTPDGGGLLDTLSFILLLGLPLSAPNAVLDGSVCTLNPKKCKKIESEVWSSIQQAAEDHYDRSRACSFTSFVGYEWTGTPNFGNQHRNVFFKNQNVPERPISYFDAPQQTELWTMLDQECTDAGTGCEVLTIPHNSNLGNGDFFKPEIRSGVPYDSATAAQRQRLEPIVEIYQHKGASECINSSASYGSNDELCDFELIIDDICELDGNDSEECLPLCSDFNLLLGGGLTGACVEPSEFVRGGLRRGLEEYQRVGVNPFKFGFIGSTDNHNATPGEVDEKGWLGHVGTNDDNVEERITVSDLVNSPIIDVAATLIPGVDALLGIGSVSVYSPGGLAVVWSEQNTRNALFENMKKKETYATSGPRMLVRTFSGDNIPNDLCSRPDFVQSGYQNGVPMGSDLPSNTESPKIAIHASMDSGTPNNPGNPLEKLQVVKGWVDDNGVSHERVYDVAGDTTDYGNDIGVDLTTCSSTRSVFSNLCTVWQDPDFNKNHSTFYYTRVVEVPSCRWSKLQCNAEFQQRNVSCNSLDVDSPLQACCDGSLPDTIQERAWTSPNWFKS